MNAEEIGEKILALVDDPQQADRHHWTAVALCGWLKENRELQISYRTLVRYLHEQNYARRIPRPPPEPPDRDQWLAQREAFLPEPLKLHEDEKVTFFLAMKLALRAIPAPANAGSNAAHARLKDTTADTFVKTLSARSIREPDRSALRY